MKEIWKYSEKYDCEVSNLGNVRNAKTKKVFSTKSNRTYLRNHKGKIHRIVAETWLENPNNKKCVNHKNLDKHDNRIENLEWVTYKENSKHAGYNGVIKNQKLNGELADIIRKEYVPRKVSTYTLAKKYNVTQAAIWQIVSKKTY